MAGGRPSVAAVAGRHAHQPPRHVDDVDSAFQRAIDAGAKEERAVQDQFYGDRSGTFLDPFGHRWNLATHVEDVSEEELQRRMKEFSKKQMQAEPA